MALEKLVSLLSKSSELATSLMSQGWVIRSSVRNENNTFVYEWVIAIVSITFRTEEMLRYPCKITRVWQNALANLRRGLHCISFWTQLELECETWYHHPRRLQCVKFSKSQRDIIDAVTISKIFLFEIICNVAYHSAAKITFPIAQPSNKATKCGIGGFWKLKIKPNLGCCSNIAITISYISVFVSSR